MGFQRVGEGTKTGFALLASVAAATVVLLTASPAWAQAGSSQPAHGRLTIAAKGGPVISTLNYSASKNYFSGRFGALAGAAVGLHLLNWLGAEVDVTYLRKTANDAFNATYTYDFVALPVLLRLDLGSSTRRNIGVYALVGASFDRLVQANLTTALATSDLKALNLANDSDVDLVAGIGVDYKRFMIEGRYIGGTRSLARNLPGTIKSRALAMLAGFRFK